jgi:hypothetical protein
MYFTEADFDNDVNYIEVPDRDASTPYGEWKGPVEAGQVWFKSTTATSNIELVTFQRRG